MSLLLLAAGCAPSGPQGNMAAGEGSAPATVTKAAGPTPGVRTSNFVPGRAARVFIFAGVDGNCASLPAPELTVTRPPAKGDVSFRPGQQTKFAVTATDSCIGAKAVGTGVYCTARE